MTSSALTRVLSNKGPFTKKIALPNIFLCRLGDLCTCCGSWAILVSVQDNFCGFSAEDEQTGSNWFLLSQAFNQKRNILLQISSLLYLICLVTSIWWWLPHWRTHWNSYVFEVVVAKCQHDNLEKRKMPMFFQHWRILPKLKLWLLLVDLFFKS